MLRPPFWPRPQHDFELKWRVTRGNASAVWTVVCLNSSRRTRLAPYGMAAHLHCGDSCSGVTKPPDKRMPSSSTLKAPTGASINGGLAKAIEIYASTNGLSAETLLKQRAVGPDASRSVRTLFSPCFPHRAPIPVHEMSCVEFKV